MPSFSPLRQNLQRNNRKKPCLYFLILVNRYISVYQILDLLYTKFNMNNLRNIAENINSLGIFKGSIKYEEPLKNYTTFKVGGKARVFAEPENTESLEFLLGELSKAKVPSFILGGGSNLVPQDEDLECFVISTKNLNKVNYQTGKEKEDFILFAEAGTSIKSITDFCVENSFSGLENFGGLPGSVGGACYMNARCYETSFSDVLLSVKYLDFENNEKTGYSLPVVKEYFFDDKDWDYKKSPFQNTKKVILQVALRVKAGNQAEIKEKTEHFVKDREEKGHFKFPSAGSVFKNNRDFGKPSGKIVDECGLRGNAVGDAQIAPWHGNFIINREKASATDIRKLVENTKKTVAEKTGFNLECEILFVDGGIVR